MTGEVELTRLREPTGTVIITLSRPGKANAYTQAMLARLNEIVSELEQDPTVRALIIAGGGVHFCSGADRDEILRRNGEDALDLLSRRVFDGIARTRHATVAAINGAAFGGGFELALACDLRVCGPSARFALPETTLGLIPAAGAIQRLVRMVGVARTKELVMFGRELDGTTAHQWGIASAVELNALDAAVAITNSLQSRDCIAQRLAKCAIDASPSRADMALESATQAFLYDRRARR